MLNKLLAGNRKFFIALSTGLVSTVLLILGKLDAGMYKDIINSVIVAYMSSNIGEHAVNLFKEKRGNNEQK